MLIWECTEISHNVYLRRGVYPSLLDDPRNFPKTAHHVLRWEYRQAWCNVHTRRPVFEKPGRPPRPPPRLTVRMVTRQTRAQREGEAVARVVRATADEEAAALVLADCGPRGRGLRTRRPFAKDEFVVEYAGELLNCETARQREELYVKDPDTYGSYTYFFQHKGTKWCVDATAESGRLGRMMNHSRKQANLQPVVKEVAGSPQRLHVVFRAKRDIDVGEELLFDYGDRSPASLAAFPWLND